MIIKHCQVTQVNWHFISSPGRWWQAQEVLIPCCIIPPLSGVCGTKDKKNDKNGWIKVIKPMKMDQSNFQPSFPPEEIEVLPLAQSLQFEMQGSLDEVAHLLHMKIQIECDLEIHYRFPLRWVKVAEGGLLSVAIVRKNTSVNWTIQPLHRHEEPQIS